MQLGIRLHDVKKAPLAERLEIAKGQGFDCAHLALAKVITEYSVKDEALTPGLAMHLRKLFAKNDLDVAVLGCYLNLATPNEADLKKNQKRYLTNIRFASQLGAGVVGTETGAVNEKYTFEERNHTDEALEIFIKNFRPVVEYAEKMGVIMAIEPVFKHIVWNPVQTRKVLDAINSPNLQIIFDPVNLLDISNYEKREEIFKESIEMFGDEIAVLHVKDFVIRDGQLISVAAGTGEMDYTQILKFIKEKKPYIHATLEDTKPENAEAARKFIQDIWDRC